MNHGTCLGPRSTQGGESGGVHSFTRTLGVLTPLALGGVGCGKGTGSAEASGRPGKAMRHPEDVSGSQRSSLSGASDGSGPGHILANETDMTVPLGVTDQ